jgi:hypothetical protein
MPIVDPTEIRVAARLLEFFTGGTSWYRTLWCPSLVLALDEVLEASHARRAGILSDDSLATAVTFATLVAAGDPGVGTREQKRALQQGLTKSIIPDSADYAVVKLTAQRLRSEYLRNWSEALATGEQPGVERAARAIAAHLLDLEFSRTQLHRWLTFHLKNARGANSLAELVGAAQEMSLRPLTEFSVMVPFEGVPPSRSGLPANWVSARDVLEWLTARGLDLRGVTQNGALLFRIRARDLWAAVQNAVDTVDQLTSRVELGAQKALQPLDVAWVEDRRGLPIQVPFRRDSRNIEVRALHRENKLYVLETTSTVDAAIQLIGSLNAAPPSTAIAAGWAAVEALLSGPGDRDIVAAKYLAAIVACSFCRAELTELSYKVESSAHALSSALAACTKNRDRAQIIADAISGNVDLALADPADVAAQERMRAILHNPYEKLNDIKSHVVAAFLRMYKNRNLVLHWGRVDAVGLRSNLRCVAPLIGAGVDRIAHGWFVERISPVELTARARYGLETAGSPGGPHLVDLLS